MNDFLDVSDNEDVSDSDNEEIDVETPLTRVLMRKNCSRDSVQLLLDSGTDVNSWNKCIGSPLIIALCCSKDEAIIEILLRRGAKPDVELHNRSCMCYALSLGSSKKVIRLLLEAGCSPNGCSEHYSALDCATTHPNLGLKDGVLELLIKSGVDLYGFGDQSPVCLALKAGAGVNDIRLLLKEGVKLDSCSEHVSPWFCVINRSCNVRLKTDVVQLLLDANVCIDVVNEDNWTPLQCALCDCEYETKAIKLMLDKIGGRNADTLLHLAVGNEHCKLSIVKLLLERGLRVDQLDSCNETPLHRAVMSKGINRSSIVSLLLEKGSPVNAVNTGGFTPLKKAVHLDQGCDVLRLLLVAGAWVDDSVLKYAFKQYKDVHSVHHLEVLKTLVKYSFLQNNDLKVRMFIEEFRGYDALASFATECALEVRQLASKMIGPNYSLRDFLIDYSSSQMLSGEPGCEASLYDFNTLLKIMDNTAFPIFFDIVSAKFGKKMLETKLQEQGLYTMKYSQSPNVAKKTILDCYSISRIVTYLSHADMLRILIAYACLKKGNTSYEDNLIKN